MATTKKMKPKTAKDEADRLALNRTIAHRLARKARARRGLRLPVDGVDVLVLIGEKETGWTLLVAGKCVSGPHIAKRDRSRATMVAVVCGVSREKLLTAVASGAPTKGA